MALIKFNKMTEPSLETKKKMEDLERKIAEIEEDNKSLIINIKKAEKHLSRLKLEKRLLIEKLAETVD